MGRTRIKICGICRECDAIAAARAGADAVGLIFHPGAPRHVSIDRAAAIVAALPPFTTPVGLFVNAPVDHIVEIAASLGLHHIQLHGTETPADVDALSEFVVLKAIRVERATFAGELAHWREAVDGPALTHLKGVVLESPKPAIDDGQAGGTGDANDWETVFQADDDGLFKGLPPIIAAGGLTPQTVGDVVRKLRPFAVDVSSGVEHIRREKDAQRIAAFVRAVHDADASALE